jgi:hypothetical protein
MGNIPSTSRSTNCGLCTTVGAGAVVLVVASDAFALPGRYPKSPGEPWYRRYLVEMCVFGIMALIFAVASLFTRKGKQDNSASKVAEPAEPTSPSTPPTRPSGQPAVDLWNLHDDCDWQAQSAPEPKKRPPPTSPIRTPAAPASNRSVDMLGQKPTAEQHRIQPRATDPPPLTPPERKPFALNTSQRWLLIVSGALLAVMLLFPPWIHQVRYSPAAWTPVGYHCIFSTPDGSNCGKRVDTSRLAVQVFALAVASATAFLIFGRGPSHKPRKPPTQATSEATESGSAPDLANPGLRCSSNAD